MKRLLLALCVPAFWLAGPGAGAFADTPDFVPGRPGATESAVVVPAGSLQIETELGRWGRSRSHGVTDTTWGVLSTSFRYGVTRGWEAEAIVTPYVGAETKDAAGATRTEGFGDVTLRVRHTLKGVDGGASLGVIGFVTLPTAKAGLGAEEVEGGVRVAGAFDMAPKWSLALTSGLDAIHSDAGYEADYSGAATLTWTATQTIGAFVEVATEKAEHDREAATSADCGATYLLDKVTQIDASINVGVTRAAEDLSFSFGWAHRF